MTLRQLLLSAMSNGIDKKGGTYGRMEAFADQYAEAALDAALTFLSTNADEWFDAWTQWQDPVDGDPKFIGLIAVLQDDQT